jgi:hypothetical protein
LKRAPTGQQSGLDYACRSVRYGATAIEALLRVGELGAFFARME